MTIKIVAYALPIILLGSCESDDSFDYSSTNSNIAPSSLIMNDNPTKSENTSSFTQELSTQEKETTSAGPTTSIEFIESDFDFGKVFYPSENMHTFKFKNTGDKPLTIISATASCGCTIPNKPEEPILPGEIGELDVIFRPKEGQKGTVVTKKITVVANTSPDKTYVNIKADVLKSM